MWNTLTTHISARALSATAHAAGLQSSVGESVDYPANVRNDRSVIGKEPPWLEDLKPLVARRAAGGPVPHARAIDLLQSVVKDFACVTDDHGGSWHAEAWRRGLAACPASRREVDLLAVRLRPRPGSDPGWRVITRGDVFASGATFPLFMATMAWGFGPAGYGWSRTLEIVRRAGDSVVVNAMDAIQRSYRSGGTEGLWRAFSHHGVAKVEGLGTAFASKLAYFTCYDRITGIGPLIADRNTAWAFWALEGTWDSRASGELYARYVSTTTKWATSLGTRSDDVERALFTLGPYVRALYQVNH